MRMRKSEASEKNYPQISQMRQMKLFWLCHLLDRPHLWMLFLHDSVGAFRISRAGWTIDQEYLKNSLPALR